MRHVDIVGAGIGGLTAALVLRRRGFDVSLFERSQRPAPVGAGIVLAPNAVRILEGLGVDLKSSGHPILRFQLRDPTGGILQVMDLGRNPSIGPALAFDRRELHEALGRSLPGDLVRFGCPYPELGARHGEVLIGADGINSAVRREVLGTMRIRYSGFTCWRAICRNPGIIEGFEDWGGGVRIGVVPLTRDRLYVFLVQAAQRGLPTQTDIGSVRAAFQKFADPVPAVLDALTGIELLHHDLEELERPVWGRGNTVLIGDAAHAMTPNLGQGASMAIEDALVLPQALGAPDPATAIAALRNSRVAQIQKRSRRIGEVAHWRWPVVVGVRNLLMRNIPPGFGERQYAELVRSGPTLDSADPE